MPGTGNRPRFCFGSDRLEGETIGERRIDFAIDDSLIEEARRLGEYKTAVEVLRAALEEFVRHRKQLRILELFGTVDFDPEYDYKAERRKKRC
jgi:hypothetical protein